MGDLPPVIGAVTMSTSGEIPRAATTFTCAAAGVSDPDGDAFTVSYQPPGVISLPFEATVTLPVTSFESADAFNTPLPGGLPLEQITNAYENLKKLAAL